MQGRFVRIGSILAMLGVAAGAFGAHALRERVGLDALEVYRTGAHYHLVHAVALVLVGSLELRARSRWLGAAGWLFALGILIFAGTLYALAITGVRWLGAVTPLGGLSFIVGWICLALAAREIAGPPN